MEVTQHNYFAVSRRQSEYCRPHLLGDFLGHQVCLRIALTGQRLIERHSIIRVVVQTHISTLLLKAPEQVGPRDPVQKRGEGTAIRVESTTLTNYHHEHILSLVLGNRPRAGHLQTNTENCAVPAPVKRRERILVPGHHPAEEFGITRGARRIHHGTQDTSTAVDAPLLSRFAAATMIPGKLKESSRKPAAMCRDRTRQPSTIRHRRRGY